MTSRRKPYTRPTTLDNSELGMYNEDQVKTSILYKSTQLNSLVHGRSCHLFSRDMKMEIQGPVGLNVWPAMCALARHTESEPPALLLNGGVVLRKIMGGGATALLPRHSATSALASTRARCTSQLNFRELAIIHAKGPYDFSHSSLQILPSRLLILHPNKVRLGNFIRTPTNRRTRRGRHHPRVHAPEKPLRALSPPNYARRAE